ncbi:MAG: hypothetical protein V3V06_01420 [Dehalococcoidia bacterium]
MTMQSRYLYIANMDVDPDKENLFNEVYDTEHIPLIQDVPGVLSVARFKKQDFTMILGGEQRTFVLDDEPTYSAIYELESPEVLVSDGWAKAVDAGRWPGEVRPHTSNRRGVLRRRIFPPA